MDLSKAKEFLAKYGATEEMLSVMAAEHELRAIRRDYEICQLQKTAYMDEVNRLNPEPFGFRLRRYLGLD